MPCPARAHLPLSLERLSVARVEYLVCVAQVSVYNKPWDVDYWMEQTASVLIISYDMFARLKTTAMDATLKAQGEAAMHKVLSSNRHLSLRPFLLVCISDFCSTWLSPSARPGHFCSWHSTG